MNRVDEVREIVRRYLRFAFPGWPIIEEGRGVSIKKQWPETCGRGVLVVGKIDGHAQAEGRKMAIEMAWKLFSDAIFDAVRDGMIGRAELAEAMKGIYRMGMMPNVEICRRCGHPQMVAWGTDDATWSEVVGEEYDVLCIECFYELARASGTSPNIKVNGLTLP